MIEQHNTPLTDRPAMLTGQAVLQAAQAQVQQDLFFILQQNQDNGDLFAAVRHAVLLGGKRVRPALVYATAKALGGLNNGLARRAAVAVELIHCYSLVHDDLPCMDDDALRRGQPTCHIQFGEATALLAGDVLQSLAFEVLSGDLLTDGAPKDDQKMTEMVRGLQQVRILSQSASCMVVGQVLDLQAEQQRVSEAQLRNIHRNKTGALIDAAIRMGAVAAGLSLHDARMGMLSEFGQALGLAFQVQDDILDVTASTEVLGKPAGSDEKLQKSTYPALLGLAGAQALAQQLHHEASAALAGFDAQADDLRAIARFLLTRES